jgi:hypothetical protein
MRASSASSVCGGTAAAGDQVGVDRQDRVASLDQPFDEHAVAGLQHHPDLGWIGLQPVPRGRPHDPGGQSHEREHDGDV